MAKSVSDLSAEPPLGEPTRRGHPDTRGHICHADPSLAERLARLARWERSQACQFRGCRPQHRTEDND